MPTLYGLPNFSKAETLSGLSGRSSWGAGWIKLDHPVNFNNGDRLRLLIGGTATKILLRLLPKGQSPASSVGIVGGPIKVPESRIIEVDITQDRKQVVQISVYGGEKPWDKFFLGHGNGPAFIETAEHIEP